MLTPADSTPAAARAALFRQFYEEHFDYVARTARRLGVPDRYIEDVVHDAFVVVHRRLDDFDPARPMKPWLYGITFRVVSDFARRAAQRREQVAADPGDGIPSSAPTSEDQMASVEAQRLVQSALGVLSEDQRAIFVLHDLEGESMPAIASELDVPLNTAYSRLRLARGRFVQEIERLQGGRDG